MDNIKAIFVDSEGTLRDSNKKISSGTKEILSLLKENKIQVILTTGLPRFISRKIAQEANASNYLISSNGADIYDQKNNLIIENLIIENKIVENIYELSHKKYNIILGVGDYEFSNNTNEYNMFARKIENIKSFSNMPILQIHISQKQTSDEIFELCNEYYENINLDILEYFKNNLDKFIFLRLKTNNYKIENMNKNEIKAILRSMRFFELKKLKETILKYYDKKIHVGNESIDFDKVSLNGETPWFSLNNIDAGKGIAIKKMCKYLNININNTIGIGNDYNDLSMINAVGTFVCPNTSRDFIKSECIDVYNNNNKGLEKILRKVYEKR